MTLKLAPHALVAAWLGLASYCLLSILVGPGGILASTAVSSVLVSMRANIESLRSLNEDLSVNLESLRSDPDRARREARSLGWLAKGEYEIVLVGFPLKRQFSHSPGSVISADQPATISDFDIKAAALLFGLAVFIRRLLRGREGKRAGPKARVREFPRIVRLQASDYRTAGDSETRRRPVSAEAHRR